MKHAKFQWWISWILHLCLSLIVPCVLVGTKYDIFGEPSTVKIGAGAVIILFIVAFFSGKKLKDRVNKMQDCWQRDIIIDMRVPVFLFCSYLAVWFLQEQLQDVCFVLLWGTISVLLGSACLVWHNEVARKRKAEKKENKLADDIATKIAEKMGGSNG